MSQSATDAWFEEAPEEHRLVLMQLRSLILNTGVGIKESIKWNRPCYETEKGLFCYLYPTKRYVNLGFQKGASLVDEEGLLEGSGKDMRHIKIRLIVPHRMLPILKSLLHQAYSI